MIAGKAIFKVTYYSIECIQGHESLPRDGPPTESWCNLSPFVTPVSEAVR